MSHNKVQPLSVALRIMELKKQGVSPKHIAIRMGFGSQTRVYQILKQHGLTEYEQHGGKQ